MRGLRNPCDLRQREQPQDGLGPDLVAADVQCAYSPHPHLLIVT